MSLNRLYREDQYLVMNDAVITGIRAKDGFDVIACDASVFYPESGGQPSDTGTAAGAAGLYGVTHVYEDDHDSAVWHITDAPEGTFRTGDSVTLTIDWDLRHRNMQRHLGEHMLSGAMHSLYGGVNRGFHVGEDYVTIDIDLDGRMLEAEELDLAERSVNEAIWADLPVTVSWFSDYESSLSMPVRKAVPHAGNISVVTVGDPEDPFDCIACCGTHPSRSSEVGLIAIYKCEPNKGMNRIFFDCGRAAFDKLSEDSHILSDIAKSYSCQSAGVPERLEKEAAAVSELKARLAALSAYVRESEKSVILGGLSSSAGGTYVYSSDILSTDELLKLGFSVINEAEAKLLVMEHPLSLTCLLFSSGGAACGALVKENAPLYGGRGGGRPDNARAMFKSRNDMEAFVSKILSCL